MNHKIKTFPNSEAATCEKYLCKMLRQESMFATKKSPAPRPIPEKMPHVTVKNPVPTHSQRPRSKLSTRQQSPMQKAVAQTMHAYQREHNDNLRERLKGHKSRSESKEREAWGNILLSNKSKEKVSSFSSFDPLRTLHFLSKELFTKLHSALPDEGEILQMITDIQLALKRIPPEVSAFLHNPQVEYPQSETSGYTLKTTSTKFCQTPPTLYQEDTEKFQKIMEENTYRLEASCKQLELVCTNLQNEKEMTERELDEARENVELLCKRVKELEEEMEEISTMKIKQLEEEKQNLQQELERAVQEINNNPTMHQLKKLVDDLKKQKKSSDETCARLEYDMTLLKMEKEKFVTMLAIRDREIKDIQEEMSKIQEQVNNQLKKLNGEVIERVNSVKTFSEPNNEKHGNIFLEIGDTTISSITTNESIKEPKESPCGDGEVVVVTKESEEALLNKLKANNVEIDLPSNNKEEDPVFEDLLKGLTPSVRALLASHDL